MKNIKRIIYITLLIIIGLTPYIASKKYRVGIASFLTPLSGEIDFEAVTFFRQKGIKEFWYRPNFEWSNLFDSTIVNAYPIRAIKGAPYIMYYAREKDDPNCKRIWTEKEGRVAIDKCD